MSGECLVFYVGFLWGLDMAIGIEVGRLLREQGVPAIELSGDALAMASEVKSLNPKKAILVGAATRGRPKGAIEIYMFKPYVYKDPMETNEALRPSLEGRISLEDLLIGLSILGPPQGEIYVAECEPPIVGIGIGLSPEGQRCAEELAERVRELYREICYSSPHPGNPALSQGRSNVEGPAIMTSSPP